jgi:hypothetical protein
MAKSKGNGLFREVKGKIVDSVELKPSEHGYSIGIMFRDRTFLSFDVKASISISPDLSNWKTGNYKQLKRWRTVHSV